MKKRMLILGAVTAAGVLSVAAAGTITDNRPPLHTITPYTARYEDAVSGDGKVVARSDKTVSVVAAINERDIRKVKVGQHAKLYGAAFDDGVYTATVTAIATSARDADAYRQANPFANSASGAGAGIAGTAVVDVTLTVDNPDGNLLDGYSARADIVTDETRDVLAVPYSVILQDVGGEFVYVEDNRTVRRRDIVTGVEMEDGAEVVSGLRENDNIVDTPTAVLDSY